MRQRLVICVTILFLTLTGCAVFQRPVRERTHAVYFVQEEKGGIVEDHAPLFFINDYQKTFNRIGQPAARYDEKGNEQIHIDTDKPAVYYMIKEFSTEKGAYTNLVFRIHFPEVPFSLIPFHLTAGKNVGILLVITLDDQKMPVLVTTVGTCGCYATIIPTSRLPQDSLPINWKDEPLKIFGEKLPSKLVIKDYKKPKIMIHLRSDVHRVMDINVIEADKVFSNAARQHSMSLLPMENLERIPINGSTTSFYYKNRPYRGYVKDSFKSWETLLMSLISLDFFVGTDKVYGDNEKIGNPFYTSLKPWNRTASDMSNFPRFLKFWGWRL